MTPDMERIADTLPADARAVVDILDGTTGDDNAVNQAVSTLSLLSFNGRTPEFKGQNELWTLAITRAIPDRFAWETDWYGLFRPVVDGLIGAGGTS